MFRDMFEMFDVIFEVYIGDELVQKQQMQAPKEMLIINFMQTTQKIAEDSRPMKIRMIRQETIWNNFENKQKTLDIWTVFSNNPMIAWEDNNQ